MDVMSFKHLAYESRDHNLSQEEQYNLEAFLMMKAVTNEFTFELYEDATDRHVKYLEDRGFSVGLNPTNNKFVVTISH